MGRRKREQPTTAKQRDEQRIRESVRDLTSNPQLFPGRIDPKRRKDALDRLRAWAEMTGPDLLEALQQEAAAPKRRGRRTGPDTPKRILEAAKCLMAGVKAYTMARRLYPGLSQSVAYGRTRSFLRDHKETIGDVLQGLRRDSPLP